MDKSKVARKYVSLVDQVIEPTRTLVPAFTAITRVDRPDPDPIFARTKDILPENREGFFLEWCDLTMKDLVGR